MNGNDIQDAPNRLGAGCKCKGIKAKLKDAAHGAAFVAPPFTRGASPWAYAFGIASLWGPKSG